MPDTSYKVRFWKTTITKRLKGSSYKTRWTVDGKPFSETFPNRTQEESFRSALVTAARRGEAFDVTTGLPLSMVREKASTLSWFDFACSYVDAKWSRLAGNSRRNTAKSLALATEAMISTDRGRPDSALLRRALVGWAFNTNRRDVVPQPADVRQSLKWIASNTRPVADLANTELAQAVVDHLGKKVNGSPAAASTAERNRGPFVNAMEVAVLRGLLTANPTAGIKRKAVKPVRAIDKRRVANPVQARTLLIAVPDQGPSGPQLQAFFGALYFAGLRPEEAANLREANLELPWRKWNPRVPWWAAPADAGGDLHLSRSAPSPGSAWSNSGKRRDDRPLKGRNEGDTRTVPCPPELTYLLCEHIAWFGTDAAGRLFWGIRGGDLSESTYGHLWDRTRRAVFTADVYGSPLAQRPYDLRHAAVSTQLAAGVDPAQVAEWAGHSLAVLFAIYAKCMAGREARSRQLVAEALRGF